MAEGLEVQGGNLISLVRTGGIITIRIDPATAQNGQAIMFSGGTVKWGLPEGTIGADGREVELRSTETALEWKYTTETNWNTLIDLEDINQGPRGFSAYEVAVAEGFSGTISEWLDSLQGGGSFLASDNGTEEAPIIANGGDTDTGFYFPGANSVAATVGGDTKLVINSAGLSITGDLTVSGLLDATLDWDSVTGKPSTFAPSSHTHAIADVTNLQTTLDGKASTSHSHTLDGLSDVNTSGVQEGYGLIYQSGSWVVAEIEATGGFSGDYGDLTNIPSTFAPSAHTHAQSEITGLVSALAGKAALSHAHSISEVTGLQTALDGKASNADVGTKVDKDNGIVVVRHDTDANAPRPDVSVVYWIGTAEPVNAIEADLWFDPDTED